MLAARGIATDIIGHKRLCVYFLRRNNEEVSCMYEVICVCLVDQPLHDRRVEPTGGDQPRVVREETYAGHVGGVTAILMA